MGIGRGSGIEWVLATTPGQGLDYCIQALERAGAMVSGRTGAQASFQLITKIRSEALDVEVEKLIKGRVTVTSHDEGCEVDLSILGDSRDPDVVTFVTAFESGIAELSYVQAQGATEAESVGAKYFLSYRRDDSADVAGRIYDRLVSHFGSDAIFKDVDTIPLGADFRQVIDDAVAKCQVVLVIIGRDWVDIQDDEGFRRLDQSSDFVRIEIETALGREIPVIPITVGGASMPKEDDLPESLRPLVYRNGTPVRPDPDFHYDMDRLIAKLIQMRTAQL